MHTYLALLRGINVGGKKLLPMQELVALLEAMGYANVQTYLQSGNVVFQSRKQIGAKHAAEIGRSILEEKGFAPTVLLLSAEELQRTLANNPFATRNGKALHCFFLESQPRRPNHERLNALKAESEAFKLGEKVFYLYAPEGVGRSKLAASVEKALGVPVTARNWNTVSKLSAIMVEKT